ncbi:MAG: Sensor histidine kinase [Chloroflexi bacterium]|nr:Sensor histidine kinase [Chloroflexota bacterium]
MIAVAVLVIGLLLILAGLASARIPGRATFARPGIDRSLGTSNPIRAFVLSPIHPATWYANGAIVLGLFTGIVAFGVIVALASTGLTILLAGVGVLFIAAALEGSRLVARIERWRVFVGETTGPLPHPYRPLHGGLIAALRAEFLDEARWRDLLYVGVNLPLAIIEFVVVSLVWAVSLILLTLPAWYDVVPGALLFVDLGPLASHDAGVIALRTGLGAALLPVAASLSQLVIALHRAVVSGLLCTSESRELRHQVETLKKSRSAVLDVEASELHRIERDLHDGAQQRLVMLTMDLGLAAERIDTDPAAAKQLILEGQEQAHQALAEIRRLVRGIAPSILLDRGLMAALASISGRGPVPTVLLGNLAPGERLSPATERAAYFVVTEALANVAKHSGAKHCEVRCRRDGSRLVIEVWDDGIGGASVGPGGGLDGLASRVGGVDGTFTVSSPPGGPTLMRAEIPLAGTGAAADPGASGV